MARIALPLLMMVVIAPACVRSWLISSSETSYHTSTTTTTTYNILVQSGATLNLHTNSGGGGLFGRELAKGVKSVRQMIVPRCIRTCDTSQKEMCTFACSKLCIPMVYDEGSVVNMMTKDVPRDFDLFDANKDGVIEMTEMSAATSVPMMCAVEPFQIADQNGDDTVDKYEFDAASWNFEVNEVKEAKDEALEG